MTIKLNFWEKCYLVALFGDIPMYKREELFSVSSFPAQAGPLVMREGYRFVAHLDNGRIAVKHPVKRRRRFRKSRVVELLLSESGLLQQPRHIDGGAGGGGGITSMPLTGR